MKLRKILDNSVTLMVEIMEITHKMLKNCVHYTETQAAKLEALCEEQDSLGFPIPSLLNANSPLPSPLKSMSMTFLLNKGRHRSMQISEDPAFYPGRPVAGSIP